MQIDYMSISDDWSHVYTNLPEYAAPLGQYRCFVLREAKGLVR